MLRRIIGGMTATLPDGPLLPDSFDTIAEAFAMSANLTPEIVPMMLSTVDGKLLVIRLRTPERRRPTPR